MKRALFVAMLLLMVVTSLNAGTLAVYTSTVDLAVLAVSAKQFSLGVNQGIPSEFDLKIAPGEMVSYNFDVTNVSDDGAVSEVSMDLMVEADFSALYESLPGITAELLLYTGSGYEKVADCGTTGQLSYSKQAMFLAGEAEDKHFILTFYWEDGDTARRLISSERTVLPLTLYVRGVQHVE